MADPQHAGGTGSRICERTGLALSSGPDRAFRIARTSYGALGPPERHKADNRAHWGRFDTIGFTLYATAERRAAFLELLGPFRTVVDGERRALQKTANALDIDLEELWQQVVADWDENWAMKATWLPRAFRDGREIHEISFPEGWWVDVTAAETIAALHDLFPDGWPSNAGTLDEPLTLAHLTGDDRTLTTAISSKLRNDVELDDGSLPLGMEFTSKHGKTAGGTGRCWAYWMRELDSGLDPEPTVEDTALLEETDPDLLAVQALLKIRTR